MQQFITMLLTCNVANQGRIQRGGLWGCNPPKALGNQRKSGNRQRSAGAPRTVRVASVPGLPRLRAHAREKLPRKSGEDQFFTHMRTLGTEATYGREEQFFLSASSSSALRQATK